MLTYQLRKRAFRVESDSALTFPIAGKINFYFLPGHSFGVDSSGSRFCIRGSKNSVLFNANTGAHSVESQPPLSPLDVTIKDSNSVVELRGNTLSISQSFESFEHLTNTIEGIYFAFPVFLNVELYDPPFVERVDGTLGDIGFRWELDCWVVGTFVTAQEQQELAFASAWKSFCSSEMSGNRRLLAALHYFHVAVRLLRRGESPGEFLAETILNFSKVLEVLFPPTGDGKTRDAVRVALSSIGFSGVEIEADYLPAMALRNCIDVGHVDLALFSLDQLTLIHSYAEYAETAFRTLFSRVFKSLADGSFILALYQPAAVDGQAVRVLERMQQHAGRYPGTMS